MMNNEILFSYEKRTLLFVTTQMIKDNVLREIMQRKTNTVRYTHTRNLNKSSS